jgi:hypothetical protein
MSKSSSTQTTSTTLPSEDTPEFFTAFVEHYRTLLSFYANFSEHSGKEESVITEGEYYLKRLEDSDDGEGDVDPTPL